MRTGYGKGNGKGKGRERGILYYLTAAEPMVVHLAGIAFDVVVLGTAFDDLELFAGDDDVGGVGAAGPLLAVGAVAEGRGHGFAAEFVLDGGAHAGTFDHFGQTGRGGLVDCVGMCLLVGFFEKMDFQEESDEMTGEDL